MVLGTKIGWFFINFDTKFELSEDDTLPQVMQCATSIFEIVFTDFRFRGVTAATISDPKIDVKSNVHTQVDFGYFFWQIGDQKWTQIVSKFGQKWFLVGDVILERFWGDSAATGGELTTPRGGWEGAVRELF